MYGRFCAVRSTCDGLRQAPVEAGDDELALEHDGDKQNMSSLSSGITTLVIAGITNASFTMPMKFARKWAWENTWLAWTIFALMLLPLLAAGMTVPNLLMAYRAVSPGMLLEVSGFGAGWGVAQVLFGIAVDRIGISLAFSIVLGTSAAVGSLVPMVALHRGHLTGAAMYAVAGANALVLLGVMLCAAAGTLRDGQRTQPVHSGERSSNGLLLAFLCGLGASFMNLGVAFGAPLQQVARSFGATELNAINAIWLPLMLAGAIPNMLYCGWLLKRNRSAHKYREGHSHWVLAAIMALFWFGSTYLYGLAVGQLGGWGPILGWPFFMALIVITATVLGMLAGEWKDCGPLPIRIQWTAVTVLVLAIFVLARSSWYLK